MKKVIATITILSYFLITSGVVINMHYCMNKLDSTSIYGAESDVCGKCGMHREDAGNCCRDEVKIIKMDEDQRVSEFVFNLKNTAPEPVEIPAFLVSSLNDSDLQVPREDHSPPDDRDIYLQNRVFRI